jgi:hypothetical protein
MFYLTNGSFCLQDISPIEKALAMYRLIRDKHRNVHVSLKTRTLHTAVNAYKEI